MKLIEYTVKSLAYSIYQWRVVGGVLEEKARFQVSIH